MNSLKVLFISDTDRSDLQSRLKPSFERFVPFFDCFPSPPLPEQAEEPCCIELIWGDGGIAENVESNYLEQQAQETNQQGEQSLSGLEAWTECPDVNIDDCSSFKPSSPVPKRHRFVELGMGNSSLNNSFVDLFDHSHAEVSPVMWSH